jgi:poly-gamma-glutamate synthesis protein (capsule biosynthesis protein)
MDRRSGVFLAVGFLLAVAGSAVLLVCADIARRSGSAAEPMVIGPTVLPPAGSALEAVFGAFRGHKEKLPERRPEVTLLAVGDIMLSRTVAARIRANGADHPYRRMADAISGADIAFGNLEAPIASGPEVGPDELTFRAEPGSERQLRQAGFDVLSLANNHALDGGPAGLRETLERLAAAGIVPAGAGRDTTEAHRPAIIEAGGLKFAFLAYVDPALAPEGYRAAAASAGTAVMDAERLGRDVAAAAALADIVVVSMHAGQEYAAEPDQRQTAFARAAVDAGADLVIGHHPHVVQTVERYHDKLIFYSLGNFIFDQDWLREARDGLAARFVFRGDQVDRVDLLPVEIEASQPRPAAEASRPRILDRLRIEPRSRPVFVWDPAAGNVVTETGSSLSGSAVTVDSKLAKLASADIDGEPPAEQYLLSDGRLTVSVSGAETWRSPDEWWVDDFAWADIDADGRSEISLSVWKAGSFDRFRPFWLDADTTGVSQHLFVFDLAEGRLAPRWQSSALERPNCEFLFTDIDQDGRSELAVLEGDYGDSPACRGRQAALWQWNDWGFVNVWRGPAGSYDGLFAETGAAGRGFSAISR